MYAQFVDRRSGNHAGAKALIASVITVMLLIVGCGQSVPAAQPTRSSGDGGASGQLAP